MKPRLDGKRICVLAALLSLGAPAALAQNLVPNPSFEEMSSCPKNFTQMDRVDFWDQPTAPGTSDYFHACGNTTPLNTPSGVDTPSNDIGDEPPFEGDAYAGIIAYSNGVTGVPSLAQGTFSEYIQAPLTMPLAAGQTYDVTFYVSLGDDAGWAVEELGAYFSADSGLVDNTGAPQVLPAQVVNTNGPLTQQNGWTPVSGSFVASGGEEYIAIGAFVSAPTTQATTFAQVSVINHFAYYYIDRVTVEPACPAGGELLDFASLACPSGGEVSLGLNHVEGSYLFEGRESAAIFPIYTYCSDHPLYAGVPDLHDVGDLGIGMTHLFPGTFDLCWAEFAEGATQNPEVFEGDGPAGLVSQGVVLDGIPNLPEQVDFPGFTGLDEFRAIQGTGIQWTRVCACETGVCTCPAVVTPGRRDRAQCVKGVSTGEGWSWKLTSTTARDVAGVLPVGAPAKDIVAAFVADLKLAGVTAIQRRARRRTHCFSVIIGSADSLWVGPFGGAPDCEVTGNPAGCTFNPTITDTEFLPPIPGDPFPYITSIPGLPPAGWLGLGLAIALASRLVLKRSFRRAS